MRRKTVSLETERMKDRVLDDERKRGRERARYREAGKHCMLLCRMGYLW